MSKWGLKYVFAGEEEVPKEREYWLRAASRDEWEAERRDGGGLGEWKVEVEGLYIKGIVREVAVA